MDKKYGFEKEISKLKCIIGYFSAVLITWLFKGAVAFSLDRKIPGFSTLFSVFGGNRLLSYISPTILASAVFLVLFCLKLKVPKFLHKPLLFTAPLIFQVYLIHTHPALWKLLGEHFAGTAPMSPILLALYVLIAAAVIFTACLAIDYVRYLLFKLFKVNAVVDKASDALNEKIKKSKFYTME